MESKKELFHGDKTCTILHSLILFKLNLLISLIGFHGDEIVITSTDFDHTKSERRTIVSKNGYILTLNQIHYKNNHYGSQNLDSANGISIETRAEVGLLSRNIKIMSQSNATVTEQWGCNVFVGSYLDGINQKNWCC
eukprot:c22056_g3_i1.p1 GENE.c22056_g3_i1~~c22056_g3_i1.p1  ORF type:complete len:137 (+),score=30.00 c22056_g3_i1:266-676(+)